MSNLTEVFQWFERVRVAAEKLPIAVVPEIEERDGFRFQACRFREFETDDWFTQWELVGPTGYGTGIMFGRWHEERT